MAVNFKFCMRSYFVVAALSSLAMVGHADVPQGAAALERSDGVRKLAERISAFDGISNADETVRVSGKAFNSVDKQIIMGFVEDVRARLQMLTATSFMGDYYRVLVSAENSEPDRPCVIVKQLMAPALGRQRLPTIRISVTNSARLDARDLARELCDGYISLKVLALAGPEASPAPAARWFTAGLAHYLDSDLRQDDAEDMLKRWRAAHVPPLWVLAAAQSPHASASHEIAAQLVAFWLDFPDRGLRLESLCQALATGRAWSPALFIETSSQADGMLRADRDFDTWLLNRHDSVLTPGRTRSEFVVRAYYLLMLQPGVDGVPDEVPANASLTLLVERRDEPWARKVAHTKSDRLMRLSAGRGDKFRKAAVMYAEFFDGVVRREPATKLFSKLRLAELLLRDSEEEVQ